jgi:hypothetical protein
LPSAVVTSVAGSLRQGPGSGFIFTSCSWVMPVTPVPETSFRRRAPS